MIKSPVKQKTFREDEFSATLNAGEQIAYGKIVFPSFQHLLDSESVETSVDCILGYRGFDFAPRTDLERSLLFRPVVKGIGVLDQEDKVNIKPRIREVVDTTISVTPFGPATNFVITKVEEVKDHMQGVLSRSSGTSRILSPATGESLGEITVRQTVYETYSHLPEELRDMFTLDGSGASPAIVHIKTKMRFIKEEVQQLLDYMEQEKISPGEKYKAPRFVFRFEHNPVLDKISIPPHQDRNATMFLHIDGKSPRYLESVIHERLSGNEIFEKLVEFRNCSAEIRKDLKSAEDQREKILSEIGQLKAQGAKIPPEQGVLTDKFDPKIPVSGMIRSFEHNLENTERSIRSLRREQALFEFQIQELKRLAGEGERVNIPFAEGLES